MDWLKAEWLVEWLVEPDCSAEVDLQTLSGWDLQSVISLETEEYYNMGDDLFQESQWRMEKCTISWAANCLLVDDM